MNPVEEALRTVAAQLRETEHAWALVGGLAISVRIEPRFTRDVDLAVSVPGDALAEQLVGRFRRLGYQILSVIEQEAVDRLSTVRLIAPRQPEGVVVDLLFASCGIEPEIVAEAQLVEISSGLVVPVALHGHLIAMKALASDLETRPQDWIDLRNLIQAAPPEEIARARRSVKLIEERGFHRNKRLRDDLEALLNRS